MSERMTDETMSGRSAGWYDYFGGKRFWDGDEWLDHYAYLPPKNETLGIWEIVAGTFLGALLAFAVVYFGAQLAPNDIYVPVKFVVEKSSNLLGP